MRCDFSPREEIDSLFPDAEIFRVEYRPETELLHILVISHQVLTYLIRISAAHFVVNVVNGP